jgi:hypothetical protein
VYEVSFDSMIIDFFFPISVFSSISLSNFGILELATFLTINPYFTTIGLG